MAVKNEKKELTDKQKTVIESPGKNIISASAGSGKTFVMIEKMSSFIAEGGDIENVLAITYTNKAAAQMKEKLHKKLRGMLADMTKKDRDHDLELGSGSACEPDCAGSDDGARGSAGEGGVLTREDLFSENEKKIHLKDQINKAAYADVCTIHSFCARLIKTYYYAATFDFEGVDASFVTMSQDEGMAKSIATKVLDDLIEMKYEEKDEEFLFLAGCLRSKRSDRKLKEIIVSGYEKIRNFPDYEKKIKNEYMNLYDEAGFEKVSKMLYELKLPVFKIIKEELDDFLIAGININDKINREKYEEIFDEMYENVKKFIDTGNVYCEIPKNITTKRKPTDKKEDKEEGKKIGAFMGKIKKEWEDATIDLGDKDSERDKFFLSGRIAKALYSLILEYDEMLSAEKRKENILDFGDLEHYALKLLEEDEVRKHVREKYKKVYVDEYQDVNEVQERIINCLVENGLEGESAAAGTPDAHDTPDAHGAFDAHDTPDVFYVGDLKQAIYGFRGSRSEIFRDKFAMYGKRGDENRHALDIPHNFRSAEKIVCAVNDIFSQAMTVQSCGIDYAKQDKMRYGGKYPDVAMGRVAVDYFTRNKKEKSDAKGVYSVKGDLPDASRTYELKRNDHASAIAAVIDDEYGKEFYDINTNEMKKVKFKDICILVRKGNNAEILSVVNYLAAKGYPVSGVRSRDICSENEMRQLLDILSCIDNSEQDEPVCAFMLSPLCSFTEDDLSVIRIKTSEKGFPSFRERVYDYAATRPDDPISHKIAAFKEKLRYYRNLSEIVGAGTLIGKLSEDAGWEASYARDGGVNIKNLRVLQSHAYQGRTEMSLSAFLRDVIGGEAQIEAPDTAAPDCIRVMTMHASKGLEFPVVIIADVARIFEGADNRHASLPFDDKLGFAPGWYDASSMKYGKSVLERTVELCSKHDDIKNELNLFYVACTRAMYSLHIMNSDPKDFSAEKAMFARDYNTLIDFASLTGCVSADPSVFVDNSRRHVVTAEESGAKIDYAVIENDYRHIVVKCLDAGCAADADDAGGVDGSVDTGDADEVADTGEADGVVDAIDSASYTAAGSGAVADVAAGRDGEARFAMDGGESLGTNGLRTGSAPDDADASETSSELAVDEILYENLRIAYGQEYAYAESVGLPAKSSATALMHSVVPDDEKEKRDTDTDVLTHARSVGSGSAIDKGTAYHKFLENCNFDKNSEEEVKEQLEARLLSGVLTEDVVNLVEPQKLSKILSMPVFRQIDKNNYREKRFLCKIKASDIMDTSCDDEILVQGTIDFLALGDGCARIVDYKYSGRSDDELLSTYSEQLRIYRQVVSKICKIPSANISTTIVNINLCREIPVVL